MKLIGDAHNVKIWLTITVETMVVVSGALLHLLIKEIFVPNLENQSRGILDIIYDYFILWYDWYDYPLKLQRTCGRMRTYPYTENEELLPQKAKALLCL
jgi:hypothetical protein